MTMNDTDRQLATMHDLCVRALFVCQFVTEVGWELERPKYEAHETLLRDLRTLFEQEAST